MLSVITQSALKSKDHSLTYTIADGGSVDGTVKVIERLAADFSDTPNIKINYFSRKDNGMYDALADGFEHEEGQNDIYSYLNAGCLLYTSPSPRDQRGSRMPSSA